MCLIVSSAQPRSYVPPPSRSPVLQAQRRVTTRRRPNFWKFDDVVLYEIMVDNDADAVEDITYQFKFTETRNPIYTLTRWLGALQGRGAHTGCRSGGESVRTGTRAPRIRCHAAAIAEAQSGVPWAEGVCDPLLQSVQPAPPQSTHVSGP